VVYISVCHEKMIVRPEWLRYGLRRLKVYILQADRDFLKNEIRPS